MNEAFEEVTALKKRLAMSPHREGAVRVIVPRLLGALKYGAVPSGDLEYIEAIRGAVWVCMYVEPYSLTLYASTAPGRSTLFKCDLFSDPVGDYLDGRVSVTVWKRGSWQSDIFDLFERDSDTLLRVPPSAQLPTIVVAALSAIGDHN